MRYLTATFNQEAVAKLTYDELNSLTLHFYNNRHRYLVAGGTCITANQLDFAAWFQDNSARIHAMIAQQNSQ